ncbi:MAG TPA: TraB/GumN family protein [Chitinophagales bacterium]|nr:TraB/GumN family protein [Chitinophagales bacterium]HMX03774.1 TraB/GumN family protein [Chitinophagales bacterium]HMZ89937.1 TraB/GumN family protein [Chitinophagales bacterium]HNA58265.1 TraB/GumN family protein [Chitinophagales bacterium]HNE45469.1 TraB/GumN family protein [Chitinophagales bacterium]
MKSLIKLTSLLTLLPFALNAQQGAKSTSILYAISGNGLTDTSYLFGTFHLINQEHFYVAPEVETAFDNAAQLAFEIKLDDPNMISTYQRWTTLPEGVTWHNFASDEEIAYMTSVFRDSMQADFTPYIQLKPFVAYQMLTTESMGENAQSYELHFMQRNMQDHRPIAGLETLESQLKIFDSVPYAEQVDWMTEISDSSFTSEDRLDEMISYYKNGDIESLYNVTITATPEFHDYANLLVADRNKRWIPIIGDLAKKGSTFVAVGAAHLGGPEGVVKLLQQAGYQVTPVKLTEK